MILSARPAVMAALLVFSPGVLHGQRPIRIEVAGLLGDKAVLIVDERQQVLRIGEITPEGIRLIEVESEGVILELNGKRDHYPLGSTQIGTGYSVSAKTAERVYRDAGGMYRVMGSINGYPVRFLVDTGASSVAMNSIQAKRLGIQYLLEGEPGVASTAGGDVTAYKIRLANVAVGQIKLNDIEGVVIEGTHPEDVLLGMSFLGRLNVKNENETMLLETRF